MQSDNGKYGDVFFFIDSLDYFEYMLADDMC